MGFSDAVPGAAVAPAKPVRIWVVGASHVTRLFVYQPPIYVHVQDGCYDLFHFGHANAIRQAKELGGPGAVMIAGVCNDSSILLNKGPTVMNEEERYSAVAACKWVDEVARDAPYETSLDEMDRYNCDFCAHGDDVTTMADGSDCYSVAKAAGRYREFKRTQGVSTTELIGRMLKMTGEKGRPVCSESTFITTSAKIAQFSSLRRPKPSDKIIYVHGAFDLFHVGHIEFLKAARALGDFLIVGIHDDAAANHSMGSTFPVMNLHERVLSVLQCRYVDEVFIGAPYSITTEVLTKVYNVDIVCHPKNTPVVLDVNGNDPYKVPKAQGLFLEIETTLSEVTTETVIQRILANRELYEARNARKLEKTALEDEMKNAIICNILNCLTALVVDDKVEETSEYDDISTVLNFAERNPFKSDFTIFEANATLIVFHPSSIIDLLSGILFDICAKGITEAMQLISVLSKLLFAIVSKTVSNEEAKDHLKRQKNSEDSLADRLLICASKAAVMRNVDSLSSLRLLTLGYVLNGKLKLILTAYYIILAKTSSEIDYQEIPMIFECIQVNSGNPYFSKEAIEILRSKATNFRVDLNLGVLSRILKLLKDMMNRKWRELYLESLFSCIIDHCFLLYLDINLRAVSRTTFSKTFEPTSTSLLVPINEPVFELPAKLKEISSHISGILLVFLSQPRNLIVVERASFAALDGLVHETEDTNYTKAYLRLKFVLASKALCVETSTSSSDGKLSTEENSEISILSAKGIQLVMQLFTKISNCTRTSILSAMLRVLFNFLRRRVVCDPCQWAVIPRCLKIICCPSVHQRDSRIDLENCQETDPHMHKARGLVEESQIEMLRLILDDLTTSIGEFAGLRHAKTLPTSRQYRAMSAQMAHDTARCDDYERGVWSAQTSEYSAFLLRSEGYALKNMESFLKNDVSGFIAELQSICNRRQVSDIASGKIRDFVSYMCLTALPISTRLSHSSLPQLRPITSQKPKLPRLAGI
ncbi:hypothetical protein HDU83_003586 [Entophlyctis luteolus]|nr:hypothetical protein HDU83_003586 [Entophlyctis luteolus]